MSISPYCTIVVGFQNYLKLNSDSLFLKHPWQMYEWSDGQSDRANSWDPLDLKRLVKVIIATWKSSCLIMLRIYNFVNFLITQCTALELLFFLWLHGWVNTVCKASDWSDLFCLVWQFDPLQNYWASSWCTVHIEMFLRWYISFTEVTVVS